jgi:hypothetical protein
MLCSQNINPLVSVAPCAYAGAEFQIPTLFTYFYEFQCVLWLRNQCHYNSDLNTRKGSLGTGDPRAASCQTSRNNEYDVCSAGHLLRSNETPSFGATTAW